ncbi:hypothetical protein ILYODFUR_015716 [Ilyodon furcidens]|uniref:Uncharacterized protein n=1 Tax=Ilyodon furcidens TaxID=33524 RepID=A0ABV0T8Q5_9TELE
MFFATLHGPIKDCKVSRSYCGKSSTNNHPPATVLHCWYQMFVLICSVWFCVDHDQRSLLWSHLSREHCPRRLGTSPPYSLEKEKITIATSALACSECLAFTSLSCSHFLLIHRQRLHRTAWSHKEDLQLDLQTEVFLQSTESESFQIFPDMLK